MSRGEEVVFNCPDCGTEVVEGAKGCGRCGTRLEWDSRVAGFTPSGREGAKLYISNEERGRSSKRALNVCAALAGLQVLLVLAAVWNALNSRPVAGLPAWEVIDRGSGVQEAAVISLLAEFFTAFVFLSWLHRAFSNLDALGIKAGKYTPGSAVSGFLIPLVNIHRPIKVMKELWERSSLPFDIRTIDTGGMTTDTSGITFDMSGKEIDSDGMTTDTSGMEIDTGGMTIDTSGMTTDTSGMTFGTDGMTSDANKMHSDKYKMPSDEYKMHFDKLKMPSDKYKMHSDKLKMQSDELKMQSDEYKMQFDKLKMQSDTHKMRSDANKMHIDMSKTGSYTKGAGADGPGSVHSGNSPVRAKVRLRRLPRQYRAWRQGKGGSFRPGPGSPGGALHLPLFLVGNTV